MAASYQSVAMQLAVWLCLLFAARGRSEDPPSVLISQGQLNGAFLQSRGGRVFSAFQGIPYAEPPVGSLRFQSPQSPKPWKGVRDSAKPGSPCLQPIVLARYRKGEVIGDEDCLYINVYTHKPFNTTKSPVLIYIHGGGFMEGRGDLYQPEFFMDKDIVLVTLNYRLGPLGFLSLEDRELPGNNGLKDQSLALRWVRDNIAQFGGDPDAVTIAGESAGGASVHYHTLSPLSKGLFRRAIAQSGTAYCPWATSAPGQQRLIGERFAADLGCNHHHTHDTLDCLRDIPGYVLIEVAQTLQEWHLDPMVPFTPVVEPEGVEGAFLTSDPWKLTSDVPLMAGLTSSEAIFRVKMFDKAQIIELNDDFEVVGPLTLLFRATADDPVHTAFSIKKFYFLDGDITPDSEEGLLQMYSDAWFVYPVLESFRRHRGPKYLYHFAYRGTNSVVPDHHGVSHFDEMQYLFKLDDYFIEGYGGYNKTAEDTKFSEKLIDLWSNFVIHGKPTLPSSDVMWEESTSGSEYLHIKQDGFSMGKDLYKDSYSFWHNLSYREKYLAEKSGKDEL